MTDEKELTIHVFSDPGHGWGRVELKWLIEFDLLGDISHCSYIKNCAVFLEEDSDLSCFVKTAKEQGLAIKFTEEHTDSESPIRNYKSYCPIYAQHLALKFYGDYQGDPK